MPTKLNGETDWSKLFMGFAVALVFVLQSYTQIQQTSHEKQITKLEKTAVTIETVNAHLDAKFKETIGEMLLVQKETLEFNKRWYEWQKRHDPK